MRVWSTGAADMAMPTTSDGVLMIVLLAAVLWTCADSYDEYMTCARPIHKHPRMHQDLPCDFKSDSWCAVPGSAYPWHAVRRFVYENQALMRRMYGEVRHIAVLRAEFETNDINMVPDSARGNDIDPLGLRPEPSLSPLTTTSPTTTNPPTTKQPSTTTTSTTTTTTTTPAPTTSDEGSEEESNTIPQLPSTIPTTGATVVPEEAPTTTTTSTAPSPSTTTSTTTEAPGTTFGGGEEKFKYDISRPELFQDVTTEAQYQEQPGYPARGINACPVKEEVVAPYWANNTRGEVLALLNLYPFEQYVHWEKCTYEHRQMYCRDGCRCEQQYRLHRLLAFDPSNECRGIFSDWFKFPSCCICKCYNMPGEFRFSSRSPRVQEEMMAKSQQHQFRRRSHKEGAGTSKQEAFRRPDRRKKYAFRRPETSTIGTVDTATPHFYYHSYHYFPFKTSNSSSLYFPLSRSPRDLLWRVN